MEPKILSILIAALANFMLATYVFVKNPKRIINISFSAFIFSVSLWSLALFIIGIGTDYSTLKFAGHFSWFAGAMMACNFLLFAYVFPQMRDEFPPTKILLRIYLPGIIMAIAGFTPLIMVDITHEGPTRPVYGKGILLFAVYCIVYTGFALILLAKKYIKRPGRFERVQLKYTFWGTLIPVLAIVVITLVLPLLGVSRYSTPLTPLVTVVSTIAISYAIVRHRLMDLGVVFRNVFIYTNVAVVMAVILIGLMATLDPLLGITPWSGIVLTVIFAAILVRPIQRLMEFLIDKYFFRGRYDYKTALTEFSQSMTRILNLDDLQNRIVSEVASTLKVRNASLLLLDGGADGYTVRCSIPPSLSDTSETIRSDSVIIDRINRERSVLVRDELRRILPQSEFKPLGEEFERFDTEVFIPLFHRQRLMGLLSLGEKEISDIYSSEDLNLLTTLSNQASVALENALLHHTVITLKNHNENILKYMSNGVIATDKLQVINTCNDKASEILRLPVQGVLNRKIDVLPPSLRNMIIDTLNGVKTYSNHEIEALSERGAISYLSASTSLIKDEDGGVTGALLVFTDLTDIKLLESEMWRADKLASLGTLAAGMAHEIKNPLVSIKTFAQLLPTKFEDKDFRDTFSSITVDEVERINSIVEKLLEFARPTAPVFELVDVVEIIEEVLMLLSPEMTKREVILQKEFETDSAPIVGDKGQLKQALLNLCLNGLQAMEEDSRVGGELIISVGFRKSRNRGIQNADVDEISQMFYGTEIAASADEAEALVVKVRDTGRGIDRQKLARIFDPFFTTKEKGLGLGLAVVHGIVKEHSGNISVDSKENVGTEFVISLPVRQLFAKEKV